MNPSLNNSEHTVSLETTAETSQNEQMTNSTEGGVSLQQHDSDRTSEVEVSTETTDATVVSEAEDTSGMTNTDTHTETDAICETTDTTAASELGVKATTVPTRNPALTKTTVKGRKTTRADGKGKLLELEDSTSSEEAESTDGDETTTPPPKTPGYVRRQYKTEEEAEDEREIGRDRDDRRKHTRQAKKYMGPLMQKNFHALENDHGSSELRRFRGTVQPQNKVLADIIGLQNEVPRVMPGPRRKKTRTTIGREGREMMEDDEYDNEDILIYMQKAVGKAKKTTAKKSSGGVKKGSTRKRAAEKTTHQKIDDKLAGRKGDPENDDDEDGNGGLGGNGNGGGIGAPMEVGK
ncbi:hypothetical protein C1H76_2072 [Elsinoe australis]|uniref:Uncharacterized protein n=1 Tax=Elsinoe australis TaxID=40998 RepID=A0A4U7BAZ3_9PEZI|nr:hypothetical protein C1H76_2072 [Elsinoe australis]